MKRGIHTIRTGGFTLVELLTVLAVVAILLGLLIPALNQVTKMANNVKEKAQLHTISTALESFRNDYGDYPPSEWNMATYGLYSAPQRLAEALIGRDGLGFHPQSSFRADGKGDIDGDGTLDPVAAGDTLYDAVNGVAASSGAANDQTAQQNLAARKGPYLELESANAINFGDLPANLRGFPVTPPSFVFADVYKTVKTVAKTTGMPILYYKANTMQVGNDPTPASWTTNTYNINDSYCSGAANFTENYWANSLSGNVFSDDPTANATLFYKAIKNPNFSNPDRPYRAQSFLLQSAGPDGLYGTPDDVYNFDQDN